MKHEQRIYTGPLDGLTLLEIQSILGRNSTATRQWLLGKGYRVVSGRIEPMKRAIEIEDEIAARIAAAPRSAPCWRCGCRTCEHQAVAA